MRILNLIGEGFRALRSLIITKESAMTDTSIINSTAQTSDAALPQFAIPDSNVPTDPQLQRLSSPSTVAPATSEETPGEVHVAPDATAQQNLAQPASDVTAEVQPADPAVADTTVAQQPDVGDTAAAEQPAETAAAAEVPIAADAQPEAQASVADAATGQASAQAVNEANQQPAPAANAGSEASATASVQPTADSVQNDFSAGVKDFSAAFDFVQQGIEHLGTAARNELFALARKYL